MNGFRIFNTKWLISAFILCFTLLSCTNSTSEFISSPITLWVVTEATPSDGMNNELALLATQFEAENCNVHIKYDIIPEANPERDAFITDLNDKIQQGKGPDIFLLPTASTVVSDNPSSYSYYQITPLFSDVESAMRRGLFYDISKYYNKDKTLNKDALEEEIMNAGVIDQSRYILPLRYHLPILYMFEDDSDFDELHNIADLNIIDLMELAISAQDSTLAGGIEYTSINAFSNLFNYEENVLTLSAAEVQEYFKLFQQIQQLVGRKFQHRSIANIINISEISEAYPLHIDTIASAPVYAGYAIANNKTLSMTPVKSADGDVIATVTYYGAIGSYCANPKIAYNFLRMFLSEESQWEINRKEYSNIQYFGLLDQGYPVRNQGAAPHLWSNLKNQATRPHPYLSVTVTDESINILDVDIDIVRFPVITEFYNTLFSLYDYQNLCIPPHVNIETMAVSFIEHLAETYK